MIEEEYQKWVSENCRSSETVWCNKIEYRFCEMNDGWIAIFECDGGRYYPKIQAIDRGHAQAYVDLIEPVTVPIQEI